MSNPSIDSRMPAFSNSAMQDETRTMIRARIECLLTSGTVATQVNRRLCTKGRRSPWAQMPSKPERAATDPETPPPGRSNEGRDGWRSNSSRRGSI